MENNQTRIILWGHPRSCSTAFVRAMENIPDSEIFVEPFLAAQLYVSKAKMSIFYKMAGVEGFNEEYTFESVKKNLESDFSDKKVVFVKDFAYCIDGNYESIPEGYQHCILIRDPVKSFASFYKQLDYVPAALLRTAFRKILPNGLWYKELCDLADHIEKTEGKRPMVIDAGDLTNDPEPILKAFCERFGLTFTPDLLDWKVDRHHDWNISKSIWGMENKFKWRERCLQTSGFVAETENEAKEDTPNYILRIAKESQDFYQKLYEERIRPTS